VIGTSGEGRNFLHALARQFVWRGFSWKCFSRYFIFIGYCIFKNLHQV